VDGRAAAGQDARDGLSVLSGGSFNRGLPADLSRSWKNRTPARRPDPSFPFMTTTCPLTRGVSDVPAGRLICSHFLKPSKEN